MYSNSDLQDLISNTISKMDYQWFLMKRAEFKQHRYYDESQDLIYHIAQDQSAIYDSEDNITGYEKVEDIVSIDLRRFCASYLPISDVTFWGYFEHSDNSAPIPSNNTEEYATDLIHNILKFTTDIHDLSALEKFIHSTLEIIRESIEPLKVIHAGDKTYSEVLNDFSNRCASKMYTKFKRHLTVYEISNEFTDKLRFDLTQKELVSLLFILTEASVFNSDKDDSKSVIDELLYFSKKYFRFKLAGTHKPSTTLKTLRNKFNDVSNFANPQTEHYQYSSLKDVVLRLESTLQSIKKRGKF